MIEAMALHEDLNRYRCPKCGETVFELKKFVSFRDQTLELVDEMQLGIVCTSCGNERLLIREDGVYRTTKDLLK